MPSVGKHAHLIAELTACAKAVGLQIYTSPDMTLEQIVEHFITAFKTKSAGGPEPDEDENEEYTDSAPVMMSATLTDRERLILKATVKSVAQDYRNRIRSLRQRGIIEDGIQKELESKVPAIRLSAGSIDEKGDIKPTELGIEIAAYERLTKTGKPGAFTTARPDPKKRRQ